MYLVNVQHQSYYYGLSETNVTNCVFISAAEDLRPKNTNRTVMAWKYLRREQIITQVSGEFCFSLLMISGKWGCEAQVAEKARKLLLLLG